jgi:hypothetical protein
MRVLDSGQRLLELLHDAGDVVSLIMYWKHD